MLVRHALILFVCIILHYDPNAQQIDSLGNLSLENIDTWKIHSSLIGEDYVLYVLKTDNYDTTKNELPVLYMTDGDWNMTVAMNCLSMLRQDYITHEPLVVGIGYGKNKNMRFRDLDPQTGGPKFLSFIEKEVIPFIDNTYRTNNERAIYGYSMGGMFTNYILFNHADLFQKIFIGAPGNNGYTLMHAARNYFATHNDLKSKVFIGVGSFEKEVVRNIDSFTNYLMSKKLPNLEIRSDITPNAGHGAGLAQVMQNAIAFGYCERNKEVKIDPSVFKKYTGHYVYYENQKRQEEVDIYTKNGKLFMKWKAPTAIPEELLPVSNNQFFIPANEKLIYQFDNNELVIKVVNDKDYHLVKE